MSLRSDDLGSVVERYTKDDFRQLVVTAETIPAFLGGLCELEDHGESGLVREASPRSDRSMADGRERALDWVCNRYEDRGARSSGRDRLGPGVWCDHPGRGAPGARQWAGRSVR